MARLTPVTTSHPRIHFTADDLDALKERAAGSHSLYYEKLIETADQFARKRVPETFGLSDADRIYGDMLPVLAMAHLISSEKRYLSACRRILERILDIEIWGDGLNLVTGHYMTGVAITYDWLNSALPPELLEKARASLTEHAARILEYSTEQRIWWHDMFLHNWSHVIIGSLAYAGAALYGEVDEAGDWIDFADDYFAQVNKALPEDGSYQEGQAYLTYALECIVRYWDLAKGLFGRDHFGCPWGRRVPYFLIHFSTPKMRPQDNCMVFGDGPRHFEWHGPVHIFQRLASEYRDEVIGGFAQRLARAGIGLTRGGAWASMLWYDADLDERGLEHLPTTGFFEDIDSLSMRSSWEEDAVMVGFKCTNNMLRKSRRLYPGRDLGSGHAQPDAASFQIYAFGELLAIHPGYTHYKRSADVNTFIVNNTEQLGGDRTWFDVLGAQSYPCEINKVVADDAFDYARADASGIYRPGARLTRFVRHIVFLKPHDVLIVDEVAAEIKSTFEWRMHADGEIVRISDQFHVRKNDARMRVMFLAPDGAQAKISTHKVIGASHTTPKRTALLSARPPAKTKSVLFATLLSVYQGDDVSSSPESFTASADCVELKLSTEGGPVELRLDLAGGKVTVT